LIHILIQCALSIADGRSSRACACVCACPTLLPCHALRCSEAHLVAGAALVQGAQADVSHIGCTDGLCDAVALIKHQRLVASRLIHQQTCKTGGATQTFAGVSHGGLLAHCTSFPLSYNYTTQPGPGQNAPGQNAPGQSCAPCCKHHTPVRRVSSSHACAHSASSWESTQASARTLARMHACLQTLIHTYVCPCALRQVQLHMGTCTHVNMHAHAHAFAHIHKNLNAHSAYTHFCEQRHLRTH